MLLELFQSSVDVISDCMLKLNKNLIMQVGNGLNANPDIYGTSALTNWEKKLGVKYEKKDDGSFAVILPKEEKKKSLGSELSRQQMERHQWKSWGQG
jgi:hypothetical protein